MVFASTKASHPTNVHMLQSIAFNSTLGLVRPFYKVFKRTMSNTVRADHVTANAAAFDKPSSWNRSADANLLFAQTLLLFGVDALEIVGVSPGDKMLEVATGSGELAMYAASEKGAIVEAIDFASERIAHLQRSLEEYPVAVTGRVMDGQQLEFPDGQFDVVSSCFGVFLFPDYMKGVSEMYRVTKPDGRAVIVAWAPAPQAPMRAWIHLFERHYPEFLPLPMPPGVEKMSTADGMKEVMETAGFEDVSVTEVVHAFDVPDPTTFTEAGLQNPALDAVRERLSPEGRTELVRRMVGLLESEYTEGGAVSYDAVAVIGCGKKPTQ